MDLQEFKRRLSELGLSKKAFAEELGLSYTTVNAWGSTQEIPKYVEIVLKKWAKAKKYDKIKELLKEE